MRTRVSVQDVGDVGGIGICDDTNKTMYFCAGQAAQTTFWAWQSRETLRLLGDTTQITLIGPAPSMVEACEHTFESRGGTFNFRVAVSAYIQKGIYLAFFVSGRP